MLIPLGVALLRLRIAILASALLAVVFALMPPLGPSQANAEVVSSSAVVAWADNRNPEMPLLTTVPAGLTDVKQVAAGARHSVALKSDGTAVAWGDNDAGQTNVVLFPPNDVKQVAAGRYVSVALLKNGSVRGVGGGGGGVPSSLTDYRANVVQIAHGDFHGLALKGDGTVVGWGSNKDFYGGYSGQATVPAGLSGVKQVAAGDYGSFALKNDGTVVAWGDSGQYPSPAHPFPAGLSDVKQIAAGGTARVALKNDGTVVAWGRINTFLPAYVSDVKQVAAGTYQNLAIKNDGTVVAWGGNGDPASRYVPAGLSDVKQVSVGQAHSLAVVRASQTITFEQVPDWPYGQPDLDPGATSDSGLAVTYTSSTPSVCTIVAGKVHQVALGTCTVVVHQAGDDNYKPAADVQRSFTIVKGPQTISFDQLPDKSWPDFADFDLDATTSSGLPVSYTSSTPDVCTIVAGKVHLVYDDTSGAPGGPCTVTAHQPGNEYYKAASDVERTFFVNGVVFGQGALAITSPADNSYLTDRSFSVRGTAPATSTVNLYEGTTLRGTATATADGVWSIALSKVSQGSHTYIARVTDGASSQPSTLIVDTKKPNVTKMSPAPKAAGVMADASVYAILSEPMRAASINTTTVTLVRNGTTTEIPATVSYDDTLRRAKLDPSTDLAAGARYQATVTTGTQDLAGNPLKKTRTWTFTVRR